MTAKKKSKKKQTKAKATERKKKVATKRPKAMKQRVSRQSQKKAAQKKSAGRKGPARRAAVVPKKKVQSAARASSRPPSRELLNTDSGLQSGDLQGLLNTAEADSESAGELLEEGNVFEAGVVSGVEDAGNKPGREVRTRQVPEDDVPEEYLGRE